MSEGGWSEVLGWGAVGDSRSNVQRPPQTPIKQVPPSFGVFSSSPQSSEYKSAVDDGRDISRSRSKLSSLNTREDDWAQTRVRVFREWITKTMEHTRYLSITPSERAVDRGTCKSSRWNLPRALGSTESLMRAELLEILPKNVRSTCVLEEALDVQSMLTLAMKLLLPTSAIHVWLVWTLYVEQPLRPARNFKTARTVLRRWVQDVKVAVVQLNALPDAATLLQAVLPFLSSFLICRGPTLAELYQRCHEDVGNRRSQTQAYAVDNPFCEAVNAPNGKNLCVRVLRLILVAMLVPIELPNAQFITQEPMHQGASIVAAKNTDLLLAPVLNVTLPRRDLAR
eukprot:218261-Amphidinium_carterae.1